MRSKNLARRGPILLVAVLTLAGLATPTAATATNDPLYKSQWGPGQVRAEQSWQRTTGKGALIGIVDSGIDLDHPDLIGKTVAGKTFVDCGDTGCGNGDWQSGPPKQRKGEPHGTHVAGIAGAATNNGKGIAGVAPAAKLLAVRVLDDAGEGSFEDIARGIRFATDRGADVINLSLGAVPGAQGFVLIGDLTEVEDAIQYANSKGVVVVAAAGNEAFPICDEPGFDTGVVCVTATDRREVNSLYSNKPLKPDLIGVAAPGGAGVPFCGEDVLSTVPPGRGTTACGYPRDKAYDEYAGTSMASPHAAGVAALLAAQGCTRGQTIELFEDTSRQPGGARGTFTPLYGYGIVDADAATAAAGAKCTAAGAGTAQTSGKKGHGGGKGRRAELLGQL